MTKEQKEFIKMLLEGYIKGEEALMDEHYCSDEEIDIAKESKQKMIEKAERLFDIK